MLDRLSPQHFADVIRREVIHDAETRHRLRIADEGLPMFGIVALELIEILRKGPDDHAEPCHEPVSLRDRIKLSDCSKFVEHEQRGKRAL